MKTRKIGKVFVVLMVSLIAFGCGSCANAVNGGNDFTKGLFSTSIAWNTQEQISVMGDSSFKPIYIYKHYYNNNTNSTNSTSVSNNTNNNIPKPVTNITKRN